MQLASGQKAIVESLVPLRTPDESGELKALDLTVRDDGDAFAPVHGRSKVRLPKRLRGGAVELGRSGVRIDIAAPASDTVGSDEDGGVFYANAERDTDVVVVPELTGVEIFHLLRSAAAPERFVLGYGGGVVLRELKEGGVDVLRDGKMVARVSPPKAWDADEQEVPMRLRADGDQLIVEVDHRDGDFNYPIVADPAISEDFAYVDGRTPWWDDVGWGRISTAAPYGGPRRFYEDQQCTDTGGRFCFGHWPDWVYGTGLYTWMRTGVTPGFDNTYNYGDIGEWVFQAPGQSYIFRFDMWQLRNEDTSCTYQGLFSVASNHWEEQSYWDPWGGQHTQARPAGSSPPRMACGTSQSDWLAVCAGQWECREGEADTTRHIREGGNYLVFGTQIFSSPIAYFTNFMGAANISIGDRDTPQISGLAGPNGWTSDRNAQITVRAEDPGLGVRQLKLSAPEQPAWNGTRDPEPVCNGDRHSRCATWRQHTVEVGDLRDGRNRILAEAVDPVEHRDQREISVSVDTTPPTGSLGGTLLSGGSAGVDKDRDYTLTLGADDAHSGVQSIDVAIDGARIAGGAVNRGCPQTGCSPGNLDSSWTINTGAYAYGTHTITATVTDVVGRSYTLAAQSFRVVNRTPPTLKIEGPLRASPVAVAAAGLSSRQFKATATDNESEIREVRVYVKPVAATQITADSEAPTGAQLAQTFACPNTPNPTCGAGQAFINTFTLAENYKSGRHQIVVEAYDADGNRSEERWVVQVVQMRSGDRAKLGLEQWFELDDSDPGGEQTMYVNGQTGNVVWHSTPVVNPGRGLSSVVNLTYNSQERGGLLGLDLGQLPLVGSSTADDEVLGQDLTGLAYREAGTGFSLSVSGPTRVNEPLGGVLGARTTEAVISDGAAWPGAPVTEGRVTLTDADGTQHTFTRNGGQTSWQAPPGLNLRLRYVGLRDGAALGQLTAGKLESDASWELLRPDGVRFIFDRFGYQQRTVDRHDNTLDFVYKATNAVTGADCGDSPVGMLVASVGLCLPQLQEVRQPAWSATDSPVTAADESKLKIGLSYGASQSGLANLFTLLGLPAGTLAGVSAVAGGAPKVETITDASGRTYKLSYYAAQDADGPGRVGYLKELRENATPSGAGDPARVTRFAYNEPKSAGETQPRAGDVQQLTDVIPVVDGAVQSGTKIEYQSRQNPDAVRPPAPRRAASIIKRDGSPKQYRYGAVGFAPAANYTVLERTTATRQRQRDTLLDGVGRPTQVTESASTLTDAGAQPAAVASQGQTVTRLAWDDAENKPATVTEAAGTPAQRTTAYEYLTGGSGALLKRTVTDRAGEQAKQTGFAYAPGRAGGFIADLTQLTLPGGRTWKYDPQTNGDVTSSTTPAGVVLGARFDAFGQLTRQQDEMGRWTNFDDFTPTGQPQAVRKPADGATQSIDTTAASPRVWRYRYDVRGDVTQVLDPRGDPVKLGLTDAFVTTLKYDAFSRLIFEQIPRNSSRTTSTEEGQAFSTRTRRFDRDANPLEATDPRGKTTRIDYDAMGQPVAVRQPASTADGAAREEVTRSFYDDAQRLIARTTPKGPAVSAETVRGEQLAACESDASGSHPYTTRYCLDHRGRPLASAQYSEQPGDLARRVSSFAYDARGNLLAENDPNRNTDRSAGTTRPVTAAEAIARAARTPEPGARDLRRTTSEYDVLDRVTRQVEHPTESAERDRATRRAYAPNGDLASVTEEDSGGDRVTSMRYDSNGRLLASTAPLGRMSCWKRQADGLVTASTTPRGTKNTSADTCAASPSYTAHTTTFAYDAAGELTSRSVPYADGQYGENQGDFKSWKVAYKRDVVGNPIAVTDARNNAITNTFYDGGQLRTTSRPSFWQLSFDGHPNPEGGERFGGDDNTADTQVATDGPVLSERQGPSANSQDAGQTPEKPQGLGATDLGATEDAELPGWLPQAGATQLRYDAEMRLTDVLSAGQSALSSEAARARRIRYDDAGRVKSKSWPMSGDQRVAHDFAYDPNGNLASVTEDWQTDRRLSTRFEYDGYDRRSSQTAPGARADAYSDSGAPQELTRFSYDQNDNLLSRETPRGSQTPASGDFKLSYAYDSLDQLTSEANPAGEQWDYGYDRFGQRTTEQAPRSAALPAAAFTTTSAYDTAGRLTSRKRPVARPGEDAQAVLEWQFGYDEDDNQTSVSEPGTPEAITTRTDFDGRDQPWRTTRQGADATIKRTSITEYDANANPRRDVRPAGIDPTTRLPRGSDDGSNTPENLGRAAQDAVVRSYNQDDQQTSEKLPFRDSDAQSDKRYTRLFERDHPQGWVTGIQLPRESDAETVFRTTYEHNDAGWITSSSDQQRQSRSATAPLDPQVKYSYDQQGHQTRWRSTNSSTSDSGRDLRFSYWPNGQLSRRQAVKTLVRDSEDGGADETSTRRTYDYLYNANRSLVRVVDHDATRDKNAAGQEDPNVTRTTVLARDLAERETRIDEQWRGGNDVELSYDTGATGWLTQRKTDGDLTDSGYGGANAKTTSFIYDSLGREATMSVASAERTPRTTSTRWHPGGQMRERTKPNQVTDRWSWNQIAEKTRHERVRAGQSSDAHPQSYAYDANGNRAHDERGDHVFNARDQLVKWTRHDRSCADASDSDCSRREERRGWSTSYTLNASGSQTSTVERDRAGEAKLETSMVYDGDELMKATTIDRTQAVGVSTTHSYRYDDNGNAQRVYTKVAALGDASIAEPEPAKSALTPSECEADDTATTASTRVTRYCYDEFNRQVFAAGSGITDAFYVAYDGLDRRDRKIKKDPAAGSELQTREYSYIGSSELLTGEQTTTGGQPTKRHSYDYDARGDRQGQQTDTDTATSYRPYAKDANGSTIALEGTTGAIADNDRYDYDPYGALDPKTPTDTAPTNNDAEDPDSGLSSEAQDNPFRYEGFYYDSGVKTYDMHARAYRPETGRFLSRDTYASAAGEQALQTDPLTQNRYAFAGANPVTNIEFDGHEPVSSYTDRRAVNRPYGRKARPRRQQATQTPDSYDRTNRPSYQREVDRSYVDATAQRSRDQVRRQEIERERPPARTRRTFSDFVADHTTFLPGVGAVGKAAQGAKTLRAATKEAPLARYADGGGHHVPAKSAFRGDSIYDPAKALAIPRAKLERLGIRHADITGAQSTLYRQLAASGQPLSWKSIAAVERQALVAAGMDARMAGATVNRAIRTLRKVGVQGPTRIPWGG